MTERSAKDSDDFVEALARGFDVIKTFGPDTPALTVTDVAARTGLTRPSARRVLLTLEQLGYARNTDDGYRLTVRTLELGTECISALDLWDLAHPHLVRLCALTNESTSIAQLEGSDIVYVARVPVPKIIALAVRVGTRLPAPATSMGRVLLAELEPDALAAALAIPSRSRVIPRMIVSPHDLDESLMSIRERGWSVSDQLLSVGVRSIAAPVRGADGRALAAVNVTVHASQTSLETLLKEHLPHLLDTAQAITEDWSNLALLPATMLDDD
ncbi:MAG TPA: IclR family transcriptional regulator C-terminal domain-containing protein [Ilumatobacter sp.]|nr:IclR family transcriptional regulator C-terminal domain-containing protein [Ilumatobacter sp.]